MAICLNGLIFLSLHMNSEWPHKISEKNDSRFLLFENLSSLVIQISNFCIESVHQLSHCTGNMMTSLQWSYFAFCDQIQTAIRNITLAETFTALKNVNSFTHETRNGTCLDNLRKQSLACDLLAIGIIYLEVLRQILLKTFTQVTVQIFAIQYSFSVLNYEKIKAINGLILQFVKCVAFLTCLTYFRCIYKIIESIKLQMHFSKISKGRKRRMAVLIQYCTSFIDKKNVKDENRISHYNQRPKLNIQYTAYPVSSLNLLASYRPLLYIERPDSLFFSKLSSSGFFCPGRGLSVTCVSCDNSVELIRFVSEPSSAIYHKPGCEYIKEDNNDVSSNNVLPQTSIPQPSSVPQDTNSNAHSNAVSSRSENNQTPELLVQASSENTSCNHHETNQQVSSASSDLSLANPSYPVYSEWSKRMTSFVNWPGSHDLSSTELVNAGFFYAGYSDCVRCFYCGLGLRSWKPGDDIYVEHERYRPTCSYLQTLDRNRPQNSVNRNRVENGADNINSERESVSSRANVTGTTQQSVTEPTAASIQRSFDSDRRLLSNNVEVTQHEVTQNEITQHEVTHNEVIQNEVTQHEVTQNEIIQHEVTHNEVIQNEVTQHEVTQNEVPVTHNEVIQHEVRRAPDNSSTSKSENRNFQNVTKTLLQRENQALKQLMKCKACNVAPIQDLFLPCGEMYTCKDCSNKFIHCPSCGKRILGTVTVYFT